VIHTCPRCELRFLTAAELEEHLRVDHHTDPTQFERFHYKPIEQRPTGKRYLVVANQTLSDESLIERLRDLARDGGHLHLVVPATPIDAGLDRTDDKGLALASYRMRHAIDKLHDLGVDAEGEVGVPDPVKAVARALQHEPADEIIIATLPPGVSRWLQVDVPTALQRRFALPVTIITSAHETA
jgi:GABA permease